MLARLLLLAFVFLSLAPTRSASAQEKVGVLFGGPKGSFAKAMENLGYYKMERPLRLSFRMRMEKPTNSRFLPMSSPAQADRRRGQRCRARSCESNVQHPDHPTGDVDFVAAGLTKSLSRPAGNVTGVSISGGEAAQLRVELLKKLCLNCPRWSFFRIRQILPINGCWQ